MAKEPYHLSPPERLSQVFGNLPREVRHRIDTAKKELHAAGFRTPGDLIAPPRNGGLRERVQASRGLAEGDAYVDWLERREKLSPETWSLLKKLTRLQEPAYSAAMCLVGLGPVGKFPRGYVKAMAILEKAFPREREPGRGWVRCE